jgi:transposase-like protein
MGGSIGEAVRSLAEEEEYTLTFYQFPESMHRYILTTNAIESLGSLVRQRTEQIGLHHRDELSNYRLGYHPRDPAAKRPS